MAAPLRAGGGLAARFLGRTVSEAAAFAAGVALGPVLAPPVQDLRNRVNAAHPTVPLSPLQAAQATVAGALTAAQGRREAAYSGVSSERFAALEILAGQAPGVAELLDLWNRGAVDEPAVNHGLAQVGILAEWRDEVKALRHVLLTPEQAAAAVERGELTYAQAETIAARSGVDAATFHTIERLAGLAPSTEQLLAMRRRGAIDDARMHRGFVQGNVRSEWSDALARLAEVPLTSSELASMVVQGILDAATAAPLANVVGTTGESFGRLVELAGSPPGAEQLLNLWNRGEIQEADVDRGLRQSHLKPEWVDRVKALRHHLPSVSDLVRFSVHEAYNPAAIESLGLALEFPEEFAREAEKQGLDREAALRYWIAHWRLPSPAQGYVMLHRGLIDEAQLEELLKTADYSPRWRGPLRDIAYLVPGRVDLRRMYAAGILTEAQVHAGYLKIGYTETDAAALTSFAKRGSSSKARELTAAQHAAEFEAHYTTETEYLAALHDLGYPLEEAQQYVRLGEVRRVARAREARLTRVRQAYVGHKSPRTVAEQGLAAAGVSTEAAARLLEEWDGERDANVRVLTQAQIKKAYTKGARPQEWALEALTDLGMSTEQAQLYLET